MQLLLENYKIYNRRNAIAVNITPSAMCCEGEPLVLPLSESPPFVAASSLRSGKNSDKKTPLRHRHDSNIPTSSTLPMEGGKDPEMKFFVNLTIKYCNLTPRSTL